MEFVLIRHTTCDAGSDVCYGRLDVPLAPCANADIAATLDKIPQVQCVFSSPAIRCATLATRLAQREHCELTLLDELRELDFGAWEGQQWKCIARAESDPWALDPWHRAPPGGESEAQLFERVSVAHRKIVNCDAARVAIVAHGGPLRLLRCLILSEPLEARWNWSIAQGDVVRLTAPA